MRVTVTDTTTSADGPSAGGSGSAVTVYGYTGEDRNPSTVTDPEGGVSRLVWDRNLLTEVTDPRESAMTATSRTRGTGTC